MKKPNLKSKTSSGPIECQVTDEMSNIYDELYEGISISDNNEEDESLPDDLGDFVDISVRQSIVKEPVEEIEELKDLHDCIDKIRNNNEIEEELVDIFQNYENPDTPRRLNELGNVDNLQKKAGLSKKYITIFKKFLENIFDKSTKNEKNGITLIDRLSNGIKKSLINNNQKYIENEKELEKDLVNDFKEDLFKGEENPKTKNEEMGMKYEKAKKLSKISLIINDLNDKKKEEVLDKFKKYASGDKEKKIIFEDLQKYVDNNKWCISLLKKSVNPIHDKNELASTKPNSMITKSLIVEDEKSDNEKFDKKNSELNHEQMISLTRSLYNDLFEDDYQPLNKIYKYINDGEKEEKINNVTDIINDLKPKDKEDILNILKIFADDKNKSKTLEKLIENVINKNKDSNNIIFKNILSNEINTEDFEEVNKFEENNELSIEKLGEIAEELLSDLFKDFGLICNDEGKNENEIIKKLNECANIIIDLNRHDQEKTLSIMEEEAYNGKSKEIVKKLNKLVYDLNVMKEYVRSIINQQFEFGNKKIDKIAEKVFNYLFKEDDKNENMPINDNNIIKEKKIANTAKKISKLKYFDQREILKIISDKISESEKQVLIKLKNKIRYFNIIKFYAKGLKAKLISKIDNGKLSQDEINDLIENYSRRLYLEDENANTNIEKFLIDRSKENLLKEIARNIINLDKEKQEKIIDLLNKNAKNYNQRKTIKTLTNLLQKEDDIDKNDNNNFILEGDLNDKELEKIKEKLYLDLFKHNKGKNKYELNIIGNLIKELDVNDQQKLLNSLKSIKESRNESFINDLEEKVNELNELKKDIKTKNIIKEIIDRKNIKNNRNTNNKEDTNNKNNINLEDVNTDIITNEELEIISDEICDKLFLDIKNKNEKNDLRRSQIINSANIIDKFSLDIKEKIKNIILAKKTNNQNENEILLDLIDEIDNNSKIKSYAEEIKNNKKLKKESRDKKVNDIINLYKENINNLKENQIEELYTKLKNILFDNEKNYENNIKKESAVTKYLIQKEKENNINIVGNILNYLSEKDRNKILEKLRKDFKKEDNKCQLENLDNIINKLSKKKLYEERIARNLKKIEKPEDIKNEELTQSKLKELVNECVNELSINNNIYQNQKVIDNIANKINRLNQENKSLVIKEIEKKSLTNERKEQIKQLINTLNNLEEMKLFKKIVKEKLYLRKAKEIIENKDDLGIIVTEKKLDGQRPQNVLCVEPKDLGEEDLVKIDKYVKADLFPLNEKYKSDSKILNKKKYLSNLEEYKQEKKEEHNIENVSNVLAKLSRSERKTIISSIKKEANNKGQKGAYSRLVQMIAKSKKEKMKQQNKKKDELIKNINFSKANEKENTEEASNKEENNSNKSSQSTKKDENINPKKRRIGKWTINKGYLEINQVF